MFRVYPFQLLRFRFRGVAVTAAVEGRHSLFGIAAHHPRTAEQTWDTRCQFNHAGRSTPTLACYLYSYCGLAFCGLGTSTSAVNN